MSRRTLLAAAAIAFAGGAGWSWYKSRPSADAATEQATLAQLMSYRWKDANQQPIELKPMAGRVVVLNFWATWCPPCVEEMPELSALATELGSQNVQLLGIGIDSEANIRQFADKHRISYPLPVVGTAGLDWIRDLGNPSGALPFTVVIDRNGAVISRILGKVDIRKLREQLLRLSRN